jgi:hypothetical protein
MTIIKYYREMQYGSERELIHPDNASEARMIAMLTGRKTIDQTVRGLVQSISAGSVLFKEVLAPARNQPSQSKCSCGRLFTDHDGEYTNCPDCFYNVR